MSEVIAILGVSIGLGTLIAWLAWRRLEAEEHDVLHTHPKLVVSLIVAASMILGVQGVGIRFGAQALRLVESATDPDGEVARRGAEGQIVVVADIEDVSIAAASCAQINQGLDAIRDCVVAEVERQRGLKPVLTQRPTTTTTEAP